MEKVCKQCGKGFTHIQAGRGRPPKSCPECRAGLNKAPVVLREETPRERRHVAGTPKVGEKVVHLSFPAKYATPVTLLRVDGDRAVVLNRGEEMTTSFSKLSRYILA